VRNFASELRRLREERQLTQEALARLLKVKRATLTQWESARFRPARTKVVALDEHLGANGTLIALDEAERTGAEPPHLDGTSRADGQEQYVPLSEVFAKAGDRLVTAIVRHPGEDPGSPENVGWTHNIGGRGRKPTPWSTAFGISTLLSLDRADVDFGELATSLARRQVGGGWSNRELTVPRPEVTAAVLDALSRIGPGRSDEAVADLPAAWAWLETSLDAVERGRPYVLSAVLEAVVRLRPDSSFVGTLVRALLEARREFGGVPLWPADATADARLLEASLTHTARAVVALRCVHERAATPELDDAIGRATEWIVSWPRGDDGVTEVLRDERNPDSRGLDVPINHFTAAWVVRALLGTDSAPTGRMQVALDMLWDAYELAEGLWIWRLDGRLPVWMTHDALLALRSVALAGYATPFPTSPPESDLDPAPGDGS
jgi:transcriptional regulator with XRE-family HTH domain